MKINAKNFKKPKTNKKKVVKSSIKNIARIETKKFMARTAEKKECYTSGTLSLVPPNAATNNTYNLINAEAPLYNLPEGSGSSSRQGTKITQTGAYLNGYIRMLPYDATTNNNPKPMIIVMFLFRQKGIASNTTPNSYTTDFFDTNNSDQGFSGNVADLVKYYNTDKYIILKKRVFKIGYQSLTGMSGVSANALETNNDSQRCVLFKMNLKKQICPKGLRTITFSDGSSNKQNTYILFQAFYQSGDSWVSGSTQSPIIINYNLINTYTDY